MITLEVHPEIHVREIHDQATPPQEFFHLSRVPPSFHAKSEDQFCLELCDSCFDNLRYLREPILSVHVKPRSHRRSSSPRAAKTERVAARRSFPVGRHVSAYPFICFRVCKRRGVVRRLLYFPEEIGCTFVTGISAK